ncbi:major facilitator superfamily transporter [Beauveria bassiana ARSEF 2860]|uniref:Major facilitator superfamily transporter n=1 Tax=Beauveria bassiana (strain ARSEF 2860) TaxID=655819 RepID=J4UJ81_BEAB2|nr:major facilitator superfamily transporter [Beauveria bassiana ARSEF 2860]EJP63812.1 major facilitator superfamily transporter [Beauveria bassiana ARSEF 2860]
MANAESMPIEGGNAFAAETSMIKMKNPTELSALRKLHIIIAGFACTFNCNLGSSIPSGALDAIAARFSVTSRVQLTLLNSLYMCGYVVGPLLFGPLSEYIGRRPVLAGTFLGYLVFMLLCSAAPTYPALLVFRLLGGINAAAPTAVISGLYSDILDDPSQRGTALAVYMSVTSVGPCVAPVISGFSSQVSWRWPFWAAALIAAPGLPLVWTIPETFAPVLNRVAIRAKLDAEAKSGAVVVTETDLFSARRIFLRPMTLMITEPILLFTSLYLALIYAIAYLMYQAYPIVFQGHYGLSPGYASLAYVPMIVGIVISLPVFYIFSRWYDASARKGKSWAQREVNRRLPLACVASPCMVIALFWLGWTVSDSLPPIIPSLSGLFFYLGYQLVFMSMGNYLTDVFRQNSASAQAAAGMTRSVGAILLPLAAGPMYSRLGIHWAPSLLGFVALLMGVIPFVFIKYGTVLQRKSKAANAVFMSEFTQ